MDYRGQAARIAQAYGLDPEIFIRQMETESGFNPQAVSPAGAGGIAQIMPATARQPGFGITPISDQDRFDPETSMNFGAQYMRAMLDRYDGDYARALAAYNAGPGRVDQAGGVPNIPETQNYVSRIMGGGGGGPAVFASSRGQGQADEPQGLLGALGIQRRDPEAGGETALPFYQRDTFRDRMGDLAIALNELRLNPSETIPAIVTRGQEQRATAAQANRTAEWLRTQPNGEQFAQMIETGAIPAANAVQAWQQYSQQQAAAARAAAAGELREVDGRLVRVTADGVEVLFDGGPDAEAISTARREFTSLPAVRSFAEQASSYGRVVASAEDPSPAGDLALIFNYMKVLDPGSVVREGEFATAQNSGSVDDRTRNLYNRILEGTRLSADQRADFLNRATRLYQGAEQQYRSVADQYSEFARAAGLPVEQVIPDFSYYGGAQEAPAPQAAPTAPAGFDGTQAEWEALWANMTPEERAEFNTGGQ